VTTNDKPERDSEHRIAESVEQIESNTAEGAAAQKRTAAAVEKLEKQTQKNPAFRMPDEDPISVPEPLSVTVPGYTSPPAIPPPPPKRASVPPAYVPLTEAELPPVAPVVAPLPPHPPPPEKQKLVPTATVADIAALTKVATVSDPAAMRAGAEVVAGISSASRRARVNLLWEGTQAFLAIALTSATIVAAFHRPEIPSTLTNALFVVLGFYFGRMNYRPMTQNNHQADTVPPES
jgi:hypothetical protein